MTFQKILLHPSVGKIMAVCKSHTHGPTRKDYTVINYQCTIYCKATWQNLTNFQTKKAQKIKPNRVTLNAVSDFHGLPCAGASCELATVVNGIRSYKRTTPTIKAGLQIKQSGFEARQGHCVGRHTLLSQCLSPPKCVFKMGTSKFMLWVYL